MNPLLNESSSLGEWLTFINDASPKKINLDLNHIVNANKHLAIKPNFPLILVAGTNGKGSTCALLESIFTQAKYKVGCYTSPHLFEFNERIKINQIPCNDKEISKSINFIDKNKKGELLTYFEITTLAAVNIFCENKVDLAILEVGLGGRLDAVNIFDPDVSIITSIGFDHQDYLGASIEEIALEKSGILRPNKHAIINSKTGVNTIIEYGKNVNSKLSLIGIDYSVTEDKGKLNYNSVKSSILGLPYPNLLGKKQIENLGAALRAIDLLSNKFNVSNENVAKGIVNVNLRGRLEIFSMKPFVVLDVAHNEESALALYDFVSKSKNKGKVLAVFSILSDKSIESVISPFIDLVDEWHIGTINNPRALPAEDIATIINRQKTDSKIYIYSNLQAAYKNGRKNITANDNIIVFGSFFTVTQINLRRQ